MEGHSQYSGAQVLDGHHGLDLKKDFLMFTNCFPGAKMGFTPKFNFLVNKIEIAAYWHAYLLVPSNSNSTPPPQKKEEEFQRIWLQLGTNQLLFPRQNNITISCQLQTSLFSDLSLKF